MDMHEPRPRPTIYEVAKRYACCCYALADVFGIDPITMLTKHREVITATFMQASKEGVRIDRSVQVPQLHKLYTPEQLKKEVA